MPDSPLINAASTLCCPHGAAVTIAATGVSGPRQRGAVPAKATDAFLVAGCPFAIGAQPYPCVRVQWIVANTAQLIDGVPSLNQQSIGVCVNSSGIPQGPVLIMRV